jgi:hypothetical protein
MIGPRLKRSYFFVSLHRIPKDYTRYLLGVEPAAMAAAELSESFTTLEIV